MSEGGAASERIVDYYSLLFTFPSRTSMTVLVAIVSTVGGLLVSLLSPLSTVDGLILGSTGVAAPLLLAELPIVQLFRDEPIFNPRRFTIMTYVSSIIFATVLPLSSIIPPLLGTKDTLHGGIIMATGLTAGLRLLSLRSLIDGKVPKGYFAALLPSLFSLLTLTALNRNSFTMAVSGVSAVAIYAVGVEVLLWILGRWEGETELLNLLRAFILAWTDEVSGPLEEEMFRLGDEMDLAVDTLFFRGDTGGYIGSLVVPYIHPGPFRNVGSSDLPNELSRGIGEALGCDALVVHGVSTHERDLTQSGDNGVVVERVLDNIPKTPIAYQASPMVWAEKGEAKASCQIFGDTALITLTLAPLSYDDLPGQVAEEILGWVERRGLRGMVVDSHNSIDLEGGLELYKTGNVITAAREAVEAAEGARKQLFEVATARRVPGEWGLDRGMGPGGISVLVLRLGDGSLYAYIVLDGNNMVRGLRARLVRAVESAGFSGGEVLTSDIHTVNAIGATGRGYSPIGEEMDQETLLGYILETVDEAVTSLEPGGALSSKTDIQGMRALGPGGLTRFRHILESGFDLFLKSGLSIGVVCFLVSVALAFFW